MGSILNEKDRKTILNRFEEINEHSKRQWGIMNVDQMVCHVTDQLRMALGEIECQDKSTFFSRNIMKYMALKAPVHPKGKVETLDEVNQEIGGTRPTDLQKDKSIFLEKLDLIIKLPSDQVMPAHGMLGALTYKQWGTLIYKHLDHHFQQFSA